ncbi:MAG: hypothetical protein GEU71_02685 [Actinobacteria bacterium]|nr:hypothetical protein [Actinomycetota bacterium]
MTNNGIAFTLVLMSFMLGFVLIPAFILPRPKSARNRLDEIVINFIRWMAVVLVVTHVLAAVRLYETVTLVGLAIVALYFTRFRKNGFHLGSVFSVMHRAATRVVETHDERSTRSVDPNATWDDDDASERGSLAMTAPKLFRRRSRVEIRWDDPVDEVETRWQTPRAIEADRVRVATPPTAKRAARAQIRLSSISGILLFTVPVIFVLLQSFWLRLQIVLQNDAMVVPDAYVHMTWAKGLAVNNLWPDGIYPMGMPSLITYVGKLSVLVDTAQVTRFLGPIVGMLMVFGIFYATLRLTRNPGAAILAGGAFGLFGTRPEWHEPFNRQLGPLPQELAIAITFLAIPFAVWAVSQKDYGHLATLGCAGVVLALTHPVPIPVFVVFVTVAAFSTALVMGGGRHRWAVGASGVLVAGVLAGMLYIPLGLVSGHQFYGALTNFNPVQTAAEQTAEDENSKLNPELGTAHESRQNGVSRLAMLGVVLGFIGGLWLVFVKKARAFGAQIISLAILGVVVLLFYDASWLPLDDFYAGRVEGSASPWIAILIGLGIAGIAAFIPKRIARLSVAITLVLGSFGLFMFGQKFPPTTAWVSYIEYSTMVTQTQQIKDDFERFTYTMVGIPEQRQRLMGSAFLVDLWVFARDVRLHDARDPSYQLPIPTERIFLSVEKVPFPGFEVPASSATDEYYRDNDKRGRIMAIVARWAETYRRYHDDMTIYYDDDKIRIYEIMRTPDIHASDISKQFKDYKWHRGELFNDGAAVPFLGGVE